MARYAVGVLQMLLLLGFGRLAFGVSLGPSVAAFVGLTLAVVFAFLGDLPEAERKPAVAEGAWKEVVPAFDALEKALAKHDWLAGPAFSVADLNVASALYRALTLDLDKWPRLKDWFHRCWERPAAKKARAMRE